MVMHFTVLIKKGSGICFFVPILKEEMNAIKKCLIFLYFTVASFLFSQTPLPAPFSAPDGFLSIKLGLDVDTVKKLLVSEDYLNYRGDPDVSFLPLSAEPLIECDGYMYVDKGYFQFSKKKLFIITIVLDAKKLDYFTLYTSLTAKYGKCTSLNPETVIWEFDSVRLSLERPLTVKYIATKVFDQIKAANQGEENLLSANKKEFLEQL